MLIGRISGPTIVICIIRVIAVLGILVSALYISLLLNPVPDPYGMVEANQKVIAQKRLYQNISLFLFGPMLLVLHIFLLDLRKWAFLLAIPFYALFTCFIGGAISLPFAALLVYCFFITNLRE